MRKNYTHTCPIPECGRGITAGMLMCRTHWYQVPVAIRSDVWIAWRDYERGTITLEALREVQARALGSVIGGAA